MAKGKGGGLALKGVSWILRGIEFCCAAIILGIFSWFLYELKHHGLFIATYIRAVEGISGAAVLYTLLALLLVCFIGGIAIFSIIGLLLDLAFCGAFIYLAYATRHGASSCSGFVRTPLGNGTVGQLVVAAPKNGLLPSLKSSCKLQTACFAVAIVGAVFFLLSAILELLLMRHHRKEKAFGPSPNNGYTAGSPKRKFWQRKPKAKNAAYVEKNRDVLPAHQTPADMRTSYATDTTAVGGAGVGEPAYNKYGPGAAAPVGHGVGGHNAAPAAAVGAHHSGVTGHGHHPGMNGHQTTTTTHVDHDGYVRTHVPYNANPTAPTNAY